MMKFVVLLCLASVAHADAPAAKSPRFEIAVTRAGFDPGTVKVPAKTPLTLVFTRKTDATCAKSIVLTLADGKTIERELPLDKPVEITATFAKAGTLEYACGMHMTKGILVVQ
ncbi:MAG: cupredoxin domain-containing protein [Deltaproteobacteria bacterium]|nr:cupredoxin domain-containing protein [Deltaproteobacteria bacterium]